MHTIIHDLKESGKKKWLLMFPFVAIAILFLLGTFTQEVTGDLLLHEKYVALHDYINILSAALNVTNQEEFDYHYTPIKASVEHLDSLQNTYGALYQYDASGELQILSERNAVDIDAPLDVSTYDEFSEMVRHQEFGDITLTIDSQELGNHCLYVYFRWVPAHFSPSDRYLIVGGVSAHSVSTPVPAVLAINNWISTFIVFTVTIVMFLIIIRQMLRGDKIKAMGGRISCVEAKHCPLMNDFKNA